MQLYRRTDHVETWSPPYVVSPYCSRMLGIREIGEDELQELVDVAKAAQPREEASVSGFVDWRRQAAEIVWLLAERDGETVGAGFALTGWHTPAHRAIGASLVPPDRRGAGIGIAVLDALEGWGDAELNIRKNRTDPPPGTPSAGQRACSCSWPHSIERIDRQRWSAADAAAVARYEGMPVQIEGWLAGAKQQGPESCNCHSADDVDNHLWIVDSPNKDRSQVGRGRGHAAPARRAPRLGLLAHRARWSTGMTKVRISGWLLMDQEHPDQVGKTRGTIWEIHPIVAFDVRRNNAWIALDTGRCRRRPRDSRPGPDRGSQPAAAHRGDPAPGSRPTATRHPPAPHSGRQATTRGPVGIADIFFNGVKGSNEPDEYVEIANTGSEAVNLEQLDSA